MAERDSGKFKDEAFRNRILGFVLWARSLDKDFREDTLRWLAGMKKPIAVMYEDTAQRYDVPGVPKGLVRTYETTQNPTSGLLVGRHLIALGHRKIAYVSIAHDNDWSTSRLRGLRKAFAAAGITGAVKTWVNTKHSTEYRIEDFESFAGIKLPTPSEAEALADTSVGANENALVSYKRLLHHFMTDANVFMLLQHVGRNVVDEILAQGDITAIVTATDFLGLACMSALKERKVAVPKQISVIGFDNSVEGCGLGLSSYDFNVESMVNAAVDFVLKTPWSRSRSYRPVETEGVVVQRESTGPAPRQPLGYNACIS